MYLDKKGKKWYKVGLHLHTTVSDGVVEPAEMARIYKNAGYDAVAMTDHWRFHDFDNIEGLTIISGCEYNLGASDTAEGVMHIVGVGMDHEPKFDKPISRQDIINGINIPLNFFRKIDKFNISCFRVKGIKLRIITS